MQIKYWVLFALLGLFTACTINSYEKGDGRYSYLRAEMTEIHTSAKNKVDYAWTDEGKKLTFTMPFTCSWAHVPDSVYRAMLYYTQDEESTIGMTALHVWVLRPQKAPKRIPSDPVQLEGCWMSKSQQYLNIRIGVMTGTPEDTMLQQKIGIVTLKNTHHANGKETHDLRLFHHQNNVPSYYARTFYISIPTDVYKKGDTLSLSVNTYRGWVKKSFALK